MEFGSYIGVSTLFWAEAVGKGGLVTTIEIGKEFHDITKRNIEANNMQERVKQVSGDALESIKNFKSNNKKFDCIFIDAAKEHYGDLLLHSLDCLTPDGIVLIDDIFLNGESFNQNITSKKGKGVKASIEMAKNIRGWNNNSFRQRIASN